MLNLLLFGPPGAGKGTQSENIINRYGLVHLSTGDILRSAIAKSTPLGIEAKKKMDKGELVPDEFVIGMIENELAKHSDAKGFIFDGFPRTTNQAEALDRLLEAKGEKISLMFALEVNKDELIKRLLIRSETSGRPDDKTQSIIENRLNIYTKKTALVIDYYSKQNKFVPIDGIGTIDDIFGQLKEKIEATL